MVYVKLIVLFETIRLTIQKPSPGSAQTPAPSLSGRLKQHQKRALIEKLPDAVASSYCGVGNPFSLGKINQGEQILDIGCGAGVDTIK